MTVFGQVAVSAGTTDIDLAAEMVTTAVDELVALKGLVLVDVSAVELASEKAELMVDWWDVWPRAVTTVCAMVGVRASVEVVLLVGWSDTKLAD